MGIKDLLGQEKVKARIQEYILSGNVPDSIIMNGNNPYEIKNFILALAKALNCLNIEHDFCDECVNCLEINKEIFVDIHSFQPQGVFYKKEQIMTLLEELQRRPLKGKKKIFILEKADSLNESSANSLLKVIEEPPLDTFFILITRNHRALLPTIRSRCHLLSFKNMDVEEIKDYLIKKDWSKEQSEKVARYFNFVSIDLSDIDYESFNKMLNNIFSLLENLLISTNDYDVLKQFQGEVLKKREDFIPEFKNLLSLILLYLRDIMSLYIEPEGSKIICVDFKDRFKEFKNILTIEKILELERLIFHFIGNLNINLNINLMSLEFFKRFILIIREKNV